MRLRDGRYECARCGAVLDVTVDEEPNVTIHATGGGPNVRVLTLDGREIHRCVIGSDERSTRSAIPTGVQLAAIMHDIGMPRERIVRVLQDERFVSLFAGTRALTEIEAVAICDAVELVGS
jgi:hypothetical protein